VTRTSVSLVAATIAGLVIGLAGGFVQAHRFIWTFDGRYLVLPWGVVIVVVVLLVTIRGAAKLVHRRSAGWFVLAGWLVMTFFLATETPAGDIAVSSGVRQWGYVLGGAVLGSAIATLPPRSFANLRSTRSDVQADAGRAGEPSGLA
jgi:hypothetical protein